MRQSKGFTTLAVITIAIGIAANVTIFTTVNAVLLKSLPYSNPEQLISIDEDMPEQMAESIQVSYQNYLDWKKSIRSIQDIGVFSERDIAVVTPEGSERISGAQISPNMFPILGVVPALGRNFLEEEGPPAQPSVVLISDALWRRRFASDPNILGTSLKVNGVMASIVGVMPPRFRFPETADIWVPVEGREARGSHYLNAIGRMAPAVRLPQARAEMVAIQQQLAIAHPLANGKIGVRVIALREKASGDSGPLLWAMLGAVAFVLLIAVANVANLLLSRSTVRQREMAIRSALGAGQRRIIRQLLTESMLLSLVGGALGTLSSMWAVDIIATLIPEELPFYMQFDMDLRVIAFALGVTGLTGILFGLAPALASSRPNLNETLKETSPQSSIGRRRLAHNALITVEVALALVLLIASGLMIQSFLFIRRVPPGFDRSNVLAMDISLPQVKYADAASRIPFHKQAIERLSGIPGVEVASGTSNLPLGGRADGQGFTVQGAPPSDQVPIANEQFVIPGYFRAMRIPITRGRDFTEADNMNAEKVIIVDETMVRRYWPNEDPIGKRLKFGGPQSKQPWNTIIGVVGGIRHYGLKELGPVTFYVNYEQNNAPYMTYVVRTSGLPENIAGAAREVIRAIDAEQPIYNIRTMEEVVRTSFWEDRFFSQLFAVFSAIALALAGVGIYGVVSYASNQRAHEIGIRMALGARDNDVLRLVVGQGLTPVVLGIGIGIVAALIITNLLADIFYGVNPSDPATFVTIPLLLLAVASAASYLPARRATRVDPVIALRHE